MSRKQWCTNMETGRVQRDGNVGKSLRRVAEAVQQKHRGIGGAAKLYRPCPGDQAGDEASWLRWITYEVPFRSATPDPTRRPSASEIDSRVAPTISHTSL